MHINCQKEDLLYAVQVVSRAVSTKNTLPILGGILLKAKDNLLILRATDLELAIECSVSVEVLEPGCLVLPGRYFTEMVKRLPSGVINMKSTDSFGAELKYEKSELSINGYDPDEFPAFPDVTESFSTTVEQNFFKTMIKQVSIAASGDESRPVFTGVLLEFIDNRMVMVATDTHRLAIREENWQVIPKEGKISVIIPNRTMVELSRIINDAEEPLLIVPGNNHTFFKTGNLSLVSRLIEGQYPSYRQVLPDPKSFASKINVRTKKLIEAAERAALLSRDEIREKASLIKLKADNNVLIINSNSPEIGRIHEEIPVYLEGEPIEIVFNARYLLDALKVMDSEEVSLELTGSLSPGIIRPIDSENYKYLILPVRTA